MRYLSENAWVSHEMRETSHVLSLAGPVQRPITSLHNSNFHPMHSDKTHTVDDRLIAQQSLVVIKTVAQHLTLPYFQDSTVATVSPVAVNSSAWQRKRRATFVILYMVL